MMWCEKVCLAIKDPIYSFREEVEECWRNFWQDKENGNR